MIHVIQNIENLCGATGLPNDNNNNNIFIWYSATSIIVRGASQHITV